MVKRIVVTILLFVVLLGSGAGAGVAQASCFTDRPDSPPCWAQLTFLALLAADWSQTRYHQGQGRGERNPHTPRDAAAINAFLAAAGVGVIIATETLPAPWAEYALFFAIGTEYTSVWYNAQFGVSILY